MIHNIREAKDSLQRKGVMFNGLDIDISNAKNLGIKSWGRIDFLKNPERNSGSLFVTGKEKYILNNS